MDFGFNDAAISSHPLSVFFRAERKSVNRKSQISISFQVVPWNIHDDVTCQLEHACTTPKNNNQHVNHTHELQGKMGPSDRPTKHELK